MSLIKSIGLAALAALAVMTFVGVTPASAGSTALCAAHEDPCLKNSLRSVHLANVGTLPQLLSSLATILCLNVLAVAEADKGSTGTPLHLQTTLSFTGCGTNAAHTDCTVTVLEQPAQNLLKTALNKGTLSPDPAQPGLVNLNCMIGFNVNCDYSGSELSFPVEGAAGGGVGNGMITAATMPAKISKALGGVKFLCPSNSTLDFLLEPLEPIYIVSEATESTALCKTHKATCSEASLVKEVHMESTQPVALLNSVANIECNESLLAASVLGLGAGKAPEAHVSAWSWKDCHTEGATDNCSVSTVDLPDIDLEQTKLNLGTATLLDVEFAVECSVLGLHEMDCSYGGTVSLELEGALREAGTGHGMLRATEIELERLEEGVGCAETAKWNALYEPLEHVYVVS
jgi:hypothetical protein